VRNVRHVTESAVLPSEIEQLPDLQGYLKFASQPSRAAAFVFSQSAIEDSPTCTATSNAPHYHSGPCDSAVPNDDVAFTDRVASPWMPYSWSLCLLIFTLIFGTGTDNCAMVKGNCLPALTLQIAHARRTA
jgi:hypothetical protein